MPCALEAQTVIKTFCLWLAIPTYWRIGEKESKVSMETNKQNKQNTATKQHEVPKADTVFTYGFPQLALPSKVATHSHGSKQILWYAFRVVSVYRCQGWIAACLTLSTYTLEVLQWWAHLTWVGHDTALISALCSFFFLHCRTSARHGRSTTGICVRLKSNFPRRKKPTKNKNDPKQATPTHINQGNLQSKWNKVKQTRPSQPLKCSRPPCSTPPRCQRGWSLHCVPSLVLINFWDIAHSQHALEACRANWSNFTEAANNDARSPGKMGVKFSSTQSPHPRHRRPCWWKRQALPHFLYHQGTPYPLWIVRLESTSL